MIPALALIIFISLSFWNPSDPFWIKVHWGIVCSSFVIMIGCYIIETYFKNYELDVIKAKYRDSQGISNER